jgi:hypothetical protein
MSKYHLVVKPGHTFPPGDDVTLSEVLGSIGYHAVAASENDDPKPALKYQGDQSTDLKEEADRVLMNLIPHLHCPFTLTLHSEDGRYETRWTTHTSS